MENYDRQQYGGGDFGEVREDAFVGPSDGQEAEDAGSGDWGGSPNWDSPQEEQQEQGSVEGEYDPGFIPESGDDPGSEYEGGYDPVFTWGGFEDDFMAEEPVDAPAADSSGGTPPLETGGRADAAGDPEIEMYSDDGGQAGADAGDGEIEMTGDEEIEMPPDYIGQAGADGQEPNDAPDPWGGTPSPEYGEQAGADARDDEIEMPPEDVGRADAGGDEIEMPPEDGGQAGAYAGHDENDIEMLPNVSPKVLPGDYPDRADYPDRTDAGREKELTEFGTYDELVDHYKYTYIKLYERFPDMYQHMYSKDFKSSENLDTYEELKAATKSLLEQRDKQFDYEDQLEARYGKEISGNSDLQTYEQLADFYKTFHLITNGVEPSWVGLDTYAKLKIAVFETFSSYDSQSRAVEHAFPEEKDESRTDDSGETPVIDSGKDAPEIEMPPEYVGRAGAEGQEPNDAPDPPGGTPSPEYVEQASADSGDDEIEMPPEDVGRAGADAGDPEIEMPPDYVGRAGADVDGQEPNDAPDPSGGTPPPEYGEQAGTDDAGDPEIEMSYDDAGRAGDPLEKYVQRLEMRYGKELAQDGGLLLYEVEIDGLNSALEYYIRSGQGTWETHVEIATKIHELEQKRDSYLEKIKAYHETNDPYDSDGFHEQQDDHHREDFDELPVIGSDKDPASESIEEAGETVGGSYGYGDYFGY